MRGGGSGRGVVGLKPEQLVVRLLLSLSVRLHVSVGLTGEKREMPSTIFRIPELGWIGSQDNIFLGDSKMLRTQKCDLSHSY